MRADTGFLRDRSRLLAILILVVCGAAIVSWIVARGDLVGADARAYWGGVRLWLSGGDPLDPPPPYMPYVYWSWSLPLFTPWAALPWETAWFVYRAFNIIVFAWSAAWAYRQHPLATALLVLLITPALAATLDTGNITLLCAMGIWAAHFTGPRLGGFMWALATALKWFPALLFLLLPPRARLWGIGWAALFGDPDAGSLAGRRPPARAGHQLPTPAAHRLRAAGLGCRAVAMGAPALVRVAHVGRAAGRRSRQRGTCAGDLVALTAPGRERPGRWRSVTGAGSWAWVTRESRADPSPARAAPWHRGHQYRRRGGSPMLAERMLAPQRRQERPARA